MNSDGQLRLLVNYPGCPPFPVVVNGSKTVSELQKEVCASTASSGPSEPVSTPLPVRGARRRPWRRIGRRSTACFAHVLRPARRAGPSAAGAVRGDVMRGALARVPCAAPGTLVPRLQRRPSAPPAPHVTAVLGGSRSASDHGTVPRRSGEGGGGAGPGVVVLRAKKGWGLTIARL